MKKTTTLLYINHRKTDLAVNNGYSTTLIDSELHKNHLFCIASLNRMQAAVFQNTSISLNIKLKYRQISCRSSLSLFIPKNRAGPAQRNYTLNRWLTAMLRQQASSNSFLLNNSKFTFLTMIWPYSAARQWYFKV